MDAFLATLAKGIEKQGRWPFPPLGITASFAFTNLVGSVTRVCHRSIMVCPHWLGEVSDF